MSGVLFHCETCFEDVKKGDGYIRTVNVIVNEDTKKELERTMEYKCFNCETAKTIIVSAFSWNALKCTLGKTPRYQCQ